MNDAYMSGMIARNIFREYDPLSGSFLEPNEEMPKATLNRTDPVEGNELAHFEMGSAMVHQLIKLETMEQIKAAGAESWYTD
ncbi:MAG: hypothetical protein ACOX77_09440 [Caldicoprobacterales bacterium]